MCAHITPDESLIYATVSADQRRLPERGSRMAAAAPAPPHLRRAATSALAFPLTHSPTPCPSIVHMDTRAGTCTPPHTDSSVQPWLPALTFGF